MELNSIRFPYKEWCDDDVRNSFIYFSKIVTIKLK